MRDPWRAHDRPVQRLDEGETPLPMRYLSQRTMLLGLSGKARRVTADAVVGRGVDATALSDDARNRTMNHE